MKNTNIKEQVADSNGAHTKQTPVNLFFDSLVKNGIIKRVPIIELQEALKNEKEQMIDFAHEYCEAVLGGCTLSPKDYYDKTYRANND